MSQLGSVGVGLSVAFALFMLVLALELFYMWRSQRKRRQAEVRYCGTQVKQVQWSTTWRHMVASSWSLLGAEEVKRWAKSTLQWWLAQTGAGVVEGVLEAAQVKTLEDGTKQEEEEEEEDLFRVGGLWGPPRLLFTIKEETKEEMELEEMRSVGAGKGSCRASRASSELLFVASACTSPFVTPPSSPPFATPFGSPAPPLQPLPFFCKHVQDMESSTSSISISTSTSTSSSSSSSSSSPPLGRRPLSALFEDTCSFSSSSSAATPATLSPSAPPTIKRQRHPLCLLLDPPPSPSSALYHYHNRVYPLTSPPPIHRHIHIYGNALEHLHTMPSFSSFHLPAPSQPTTPCPFRASLNAKTTGCLISPSPSPVLAPPTVQLADRV